MFETAGPGHDGREGTMKSAKISLLPDPGSVSGSRWEESSDPGDDVCAAEGFVL